MASTIEDDPVVVPRREIYYALPDSVARRFQLID